MKFTFSWLKQHLETSATLNEITNALNELGLVVESTCNPAQSLEGFIVGQVLTVTPHPNADKLKVCQVATGVQKIQVICGAKNVQTGIKAVLALPEATIPANGLKLKKTKIRGIESNGMLCSAEELCLKDAGNEGILSLPDIAVVGDTYSSYAKLNDPVIKVEITPNRGDCLAIEGIARDLAAAGLGHFIHRIVPPIEEKFTSDIKINIDESVVKQCPILAMRVIKGVKNTESPKWLQSKLQAIGFKSISALVDIINYIMVTYCRPMHVFNAQKIQGGITVRSAQIDEQITALNDENYKLNPDVIVMADEQKAISIAGIIGSLETRCTLETEEIILESAVFDPVMVAKSGRSLGILTESRCRFERGVDNKIVADCLDIATSMILDLCGGEAGSKIIINNCAAQNKTIDFDCKKLQSLGGISLPISSIHKILHSLGFADIVQNGSVITVTVPSWRNDIQYSADLVEELSRIVGYDKIELTPIPISSYARNDIKKNNLKQHYIIKKTLAARGLIECQTWSFLNKQLVEQFGNQNTKIQIANPISQELKFMRPSLLANLIVNVQTNKNKGLDRSALFELGNVYGQHLQNRQSLHIAAVRSGFFSPRHWRRPLVFVSAFDIKADALAMLDYIGVNLSKLYIATENLDKYPYMHLKRAATINIGTNIIGVFGEIHPQILHSLNLKTSIVGFELFLDNIFNNVINQEQTKRKQLLQLVKLQPINRDLSFVIKNEITAQAIIKIIQEADSLITKVSVFDVYQGENIKNGYKALGFTFVIEPFEHALIDANINNLMDQIIVKVCQTTGGELRQ